MASASQKFLCNTCSMTFTTSEIQRSHMRQPWHVSNLRRRIAGEPAMSEEEYTAQTKEQDIAYRPKNQQLIPSSDADIEPVLARQENSQVDDQVSEDVEISATQCLFCSLNSPTISTSIDHMTSQHGLFIPSSDKLSDLESFVKYLATIVFEYHECLYCGLEKGTVDSVQTHMRDKGHCMIDMSVNSELLEFWDPDSEEDVKHLKTAATMLSETEMRLPSGAIINSRSDTTQLRTRPGLTQSRSKGSQHRMMRDELRAITAVDGQETKVPSRSNDHRIAARGEMGLAGVPENQIRALQITEKKMMRREAIAKAAHRHATEHIGTKANQGKYYKTEAPIYQAG
ncbi:hypothetical protein CC86DRAFT_449699 [Ophiobolus disseminans]|uniref:C2H2-type domain-containing protein n=1 Tax=Ophiobolus disseminans TaxID=1469910 RepID=A0A6A6ZG56_9PLEO|nr:hypothetical protein CC86DRAFT_449699 [Ophiobolus disseminans]